ncbi:MAG: hypothetical protein AB1478_02245 [Nitrospirota bacterium]
MKRPLGDLKQVFHCFVHMPVFDFCQKKIKCRYIEIDYDRAKEMFYEQDREFWDKEMEILDPIGTAIPQLKF